MNCIFLLNNLDRIPTKLIWPNFNHVSLSGPWIFVHPQTPPESHFPWGAVYLCSRLISFFNTNFFLALFTLPYKRKAIFCLTGETLTDVMVGIFSLAFNSSPILYHKNFLPFIAINFWIMYFLLKSGLFLTVQLLRWPRVSIRNYLTRDKSGNIIAW